MRSVILDTDIGTDVDDALALAALLGSRDVELLGVTTVYGDTLLRARLARRLIALSGRSFTAPVIPGESATLSGRPVWWPGHEGSLHGDLEREVVATDLDAVDWILRTVRSRPGQVDVLGIGPLTNIATAIRRDPLFAGRLRTLTLMGGDFSAEGRVTEHNFRCDAAAADIVLRSGANLVIAGLDATTRVRVEPDDLERIRAIGPLGEALEGEVRLFWDFHGAQWNHPHDPVAALTLVEPERFTFDESRVAVVRRDDDGDGYVADDVHGSRVTVVGVPDPEVVGRSVVARICEAASPAG